MSRAESRHVYDIKGVLEHGCVDRQRPGWTSRSLHRRVPRWTGARLPGIPGVGVSLLGHTCCCLLKREEPPWSTTSARVRPGVFPRRCFTWSVGQQWDEHRLGRCVRLIHWRNTAAREHASRRAVSSAGPAAEGVYSRRLLPWLLQEEWTVAGPLSRRSVLFSRRSGPWAACGARCGGSGRGR